MKPQRHFVATGYVVYRGRTLLLHHKKLKMWLPPGGHIDEGELPEDAALREIREETGLDVELVSPIRLPQPAAPGVRYLRMPNHVQLEDIPNHPQHIDLIYFCRARSDRVVISPDESNAMRWFSPEELGEAEIRDEVRDTARMAIEFVMSLDASWANTPQ
jgi:8-oxo-dGTP pyrophosphatase MutT (NUDIX family)